MGSFHPVVADVLRILGRLQFRQGAPVEAEGLFRSALGRTSSCAPAGQQTPGPATDQVFQARVDTLHDYALLLDKLEWNGKSRAPEGALLRAEIAKLCTMRPGLAAHPAGEVYLESWMLAKLSV